VPRTPRWRAEILLLGGCIGFGAITAPYEDASFTNDFVAECEAFTADDSHMFDDQVDPMIDAIGDMLARMSAVELWERQ